MNYQKLAGVLCTGFVSLGLASVADAALLGRLPTTPGGTDFQAYYDNTANLTWLADANAGIGSAFDNVGNGRMTWANANAWAAQLDINGVTGWRLPDTVQPDTSCDLFSAGSGYFGRNCIGSEMGHLYYNVLSNQPGGGQALLNPGPFSNVAVFDGNYWTSTVWIGPGAAWFFNMRYGEQFHQSSLNSTHAWALHDGDVSVVPIPPAAWLFGSGLMSLAGMARRKKA